MTTKNTSRHVAQGPLGNKNHPKLTITDLSFPWNDLKYLDHKIHSYISYTLGDISELSIRFNYLTSILYYIKKESQTVFIIAVLNEPLICLHSCFSVSFLFFTEDTLSYWVIEWKKGTKKTSGIQDMGGTAPWPCASVMSKRPTLGGTRQAWVCSGTDKEERRLIGSEVSTQDLLCWDPKGKNYRDKIREERRQPLIRCIPKWGWGKGEWGNRTIMIIYGVSGFPWGLKW